MTKRTKARGSLVFLVDVDNTLLDNDKLKHDLAVKIKSMLGAQRAARFWQLYEQVRLQQDFVNYPATVEAWVSEFKDPAKGEKLTAALADWPFDRYLYPHAIDTLDYLKTMGSVVLLSDGDSVFQPLKIEKSGLQAAVDNNVLVYVHKEQEMGEVTKRFPADRYVMVDDKPRILSALGRSCSGDVTTVLVRQGKYASKLGLYSHPDYIVRHIGDLRDFTREQFLSPQAPEAAAEAS
ncbi:MAG: HAD family hydrolase [Chloroflexota bacterium]